MVDAAIGHNSANMTPFELSEQEIDRLYEEAALWLDGEPVQTQGQADGIAYLIRLLQDAHKVADERRRAENEPHDRAKAAIQAKYATLIADTKSIQGRTVRAIAALKAALTPWLAKIEEEKRARAEAARREAEEKERAARVAIRATSAIDLAEREKAEAMVAEAQRAKRAAERAEHDTAARAKGAAGRAVGIRTSYVAEITDEQAFARHVWTEHRGEMRAFLVTLAKRLVDKGGRNIPGVATTEKKGAA